MSTRGGGRGVGRGVGRGRSRGAGVQDTRRPGQTTQPTDPGAQQQQQVGRGRGRASAQIQKPTPQQTQPPPEKTVEDAAKKMEQLVVKDQPDRKQDGGRRERPNASADEQMSTKPQHIDDKRGTSGNQIALSTNHIALSTRTGHAIYQYCVDFSPPVDGRSLRRFLLKVHKETVIGNVFSFDGTILYLPRRLPDPTTELLSQSKDGDNYKVTIKLTNELSSNSPVCLQLFNVLFKRSVDCMYSDSCSITLQRSSCIYVHVTRVVYSSCVHTFMLLYRLLLSGPI